MMCDYKTLGKYQENFYYASDYNSAKFDIFKSSAVVSNTTRFKVGDIDPSISTISPPDFASGDIVFKANGLGANFDIKSVSLFMRYDSLTTLPGTSTPTSTLWSPAIPGTSQFFIYDMTTQQITIRLPGTNLKSAAPTGFTSPVDPKPFARVYITWGTIVI
jgi:hypothetical protein